MGIFSLFKKKSEQDGEPDSKLRMGESTRLALDNEAERARQREIARATAAKIDAIETAMANDIFNEPEPAWGSGARRPRTNAQIAAAANEDTLPMLELATTELLADTIGGGAPVQAQTAPVIEEIAIMYANDQLQVTEAMLIDSLADVGQNDRSVWWMLFDFYQAGGRQDDFDNIAIDYASRFETSPPAYQPLPTAGAGDKSFAGVTPTEAFTGVLDAAIEPKVQRLMQLSASSAVLRIEMGRVQTVTAEGCALLLKALTSLRKSKRELVVAGAAELAEKVRATIAIGERDAPEAPWLLLLELLQLLNREKDFEETAMDYCVTYELSPPSFEAQANVATAANARAASASDRFLLPAVVDGKTDSLLAAIETYAKGADPVVLDCSRVARVDYAAASAMLPRLRALAAANKQIELRDMNHLVAALFKLMGFAEFAKLYPHKY